MRYLLTLLLAVFSIPSYAGLWEVSVTGIAATLDGSRRGIEVAQFVWDTAQVEKCGELDSFGQPVRRAVCSDVPFSEPGSVVYFLTAPVSVSYFGLVNGTGTGDLKAVWAANEAYAAFGHSTCACEWVSYPYDKPFEYTQVLDQATHVFFGFVGGEDGWSWQHDTVDTRYQIISVRQVAAVSEPGTSMLLTAMFLMIAVVNVPSRNKSRLRLC